MYDRGKAREGEGEWSTYYVFKSSQFILWGRFYNPHFPDEDPQASSPSLHHLHSFPPLPVHSSFLVSVPSSLAKSKMIQCCWLHAHYCHTMWGCEPRVRLTIGFHTRKFVPGWMSGLGRSQGFTGCRKILFSWEDVATEQNTTVVKPPGRWELQVWIKENTVSLLGVPPQANGAASLYASNGAVLTKTSTN